MGFPAPPELGRTEEDLSGAAAALRSECLALAPAGAQNFTVLVILGEAGRRRTNGDSLTIWSESWRSRRAGRGLAPALMVASSRFSQEHGKSRCKC
jgi:hypothetical protein